MMVKGLPICLRKRPECPRWTSISIQLYRLSYICFRRKKLWQGLESIAPIWVQFWGSSSKKEAAKTDAPKSPAAPAAAAKPEEPKKVEAKKEEPEEEEEDDDMGFGLFD